MSNELDFFAKADQLSETYREAAKHGRRIGRLSNTGLFHAPDAPAHLLNQLVQIPTEAEWQAGVDRDANDSLTQKFGRGFTIDNLYYNAEKGQYAAPGDPPSPDMAKVTPEELKRLWDRYFHCYPVPKNRSGTALFLNAVREEAARRGVM